MEQPGIIGRRPGPRAGNVIKAMPDSKVDLVLGNRIAARIVPTRQSGAGGRQRGFAA